MQAVTTVTLAQHCVLALVIDIQFVDYQSSIELIAPPFPVPPAFIS